MSAIITNNGFMITGDHLQHSPKGTTWKDHKYIKKENGRYVYDEKSAINKVREKIKDEKMATIQSAYEEGANAINKILGNFGQEKEYVRPMFPVIQWLIDPRLMERQRTYDYYKKKREAKENEKRIGGRVGKIINRSGKY